MNPQAYGPCASTVPVQLVLDRSRAQPSRSRCNAQHQAVRGEPSRGPRRTSGRSCPKREELSQKVGGHIYIYIYIYTSSDGDVHRWRRWRRFEGFLLSYDHEQAIPALAIDQIVTLIEKQKDMYR